MIQSDNPRFYPLTDFEVALVENGALIREYVPQSADGIKVVAFLSSEEFDTYLRNKFLNLREDLVYAAFDKEAIEARKRGSMIFRKRPLPPPTNP